MDENITPEFKNVCEEHYNSMEDNTQINDDKNKLKFVRMNISADCMDFLMDYYKLPSLVQVNQASLYVMKALAHMEQDGYKFGIYKTKMVDGKEVIDEKDSFALNVSDLVKKILSNFEKN